MKISAARIKQIIREEHKKIAGEAEISLDTEDIEAIEPSEAPEASVAVVVQELKGVLEKWEEAEYESDEARWQEYAKDIQNMIDQYEGDDAPAEHTEEECEEVHPDQTHEEWEEEEEPSEEEEEGEKKKESKPKSPKKKSNSKNFPYESKQLEQAIYQKLITALGEE